MNKHMFRPFLKVENGSGIHSSVCILYIVHKSFILLITYTSLVFIIFLLRHQCGLSVQAAFRSQWEEGSDSNTAVWAVNLSLQVPSEEDRTNTMERYVLASLYLTN